MVSTWKMGWVCIDSGAKLTVVWSNQARTYANFTQTSWNPSPSTVQFRFGDTVVPGEGILYVHLPTPGDHLLVLDCHVVKVDVPFLLELDALRRFGLTVDFWQNQLSSSDPWWSIPLCYQTGHAFLPPVCFARPGHVTSPCYRLYTSSSSRLREYITAELKRLHLYLTTQAPLSCLV